MTNSALLKQPEFTEKYEALIKGYVDKMFADANKKAPAPTTLNPLSYEDKKLNDAVSRLRKGGELFAYCSDKFNGGK